jgi:hypothetical protein
MAHDMAELGQHPVGQPAQQRRAFLIGQPARIALHRRLHQRPVGHGGVDIGQRRLQRFGQFAALARVGAFGFEVDHRFAPFAHGLAFGQRQQRSSGSRRTATTGWTSRSIVSPAR